MPCSELEPNSGLSQGQSPCLEGKAGDFSQFSSLYALHTVGDKKHLLNGLANESVSHFYAYVFSVIIYGLM